MTRTIPQAPDVQPFVLVRHEDETGVSGTGVIVDGLQFPDGTVTICWRGPLSSVATYDSVQVLEKVHGHNGKTRIEWTDQAPPAAVARMAAVADTAAANLRRLIVEAGAR